MKFIDILNEFNVEYKTEGSSHCRPGWVQFDCPYCGKDSHKWHMGYSLSSNFVNCWRCGSHNLMSTLILVTGSSFQIIKSLLDNIKTVHEIVEKTQGKFSKPSGVDKLLKVHKDYLISRGFDIQTLTKLWKIQGIGNASRHAWRIYIPVIYHGKPVSWTTRSISTKNKTMLRYINASPIEECIPIKHLLYGSDFVRDTAVICEGPFDAWKIGPGAVATFGIKYTTEQILQMSKIRRRIICFDNEKIAQLQAKKLYNDLSVFPGETFNLVLQASDPAAATDKEIKKLRQSCFK